MDVEYLQRITKDYKDDADYILKWQDHLPFDPLVGFLNFLSFSFPICLAALVTDLQVLGQLEHGNEGCSPVLYKSLEKAGHVPEAEVCHAVVVVEEDINGVQGPARLLKETGSEGHNQPVEGIFD